MFLMDKTMFFWQQAVTWSNIARMTLMIKEYFLPNERIIYTGF